MEIVDVCESYAVKKELKDEILTNKNWSNIINVFSPLKTIF